VMNGMFQRGSDKNAYFYQLMHATGVFPADAPPSVRTSLARGQLTAGQMIDRYDIDCRPVRDLLVDYLKERQPSVDYATLRNLAQRLGSVFWRDLELHNPGIDSLHLSPAVAADWRQRALTTTDGAGGTQKRSTGIEVLTVVRAFYLDIAEWALEDPARWSPWAAPCPVRSDELSRRKELSHRKARMDQRTRERLPVLPALVASADAQRRESTERLKAAAAAEPGDLFTAGGQTLRRSILAIGDRGDHPPAQQGRRHGPGDSPLRPARAGNPPAVALPFPASRASWSRSDRRRHRGSRPAAAVRADRPDQPRIRRHSFHAA